MKAGVLFLLPTEHRLPRSVGRAQRWQRSGPGKAPRAGAGAGTGAGIGVGTGARTRARAGAGTGAGTGARIGAGIGAGSGAGAARGARAPPSGRRRRRGDSPGRAGEPDPASPSPLPDTSLALRTRAAGLAPGTPVGEVAGARGASGRGMTKS